MTQVKYVHTNIVAQDWKSLSKFYQIVFHCIPVPPERNQSGKWLEKGTGVTNASLKGIHLRLPGHGDSGPTLEIYEYEEMVKTSTRTPNKIGLGHLAFEVQEVKSTLDLIVANGGRAIGKISEHIIDGVGRIEFVYATDPEGNILEIQRWK